MLPETVHNLMVHQMPYTMFRRTSLFTCLLFATLAGGSSCSLVAQSHRLEHDYDEGSKERRLIVKVPDGYLSENHQKLEEGYMVRTFNYPDGASFFIACKEISTNPVPTIEKSADVMTSLLARMGGEGAGTSAEGTHWRRTLKDGFVVGFSDVGPKRLDLFNKSVKTVKCGK